MADLFGPVELFALEFPDDRIPDPVKAELARLVATDQVRIVDLVVLRRPHGGEVEVIEVESLGDELQITDVQLAAGGLTGQEDIDEIAGALAPGSSALVVVVENLWMRGIVGAIRDTGGVVLAAERIPAEVVNALADLSIDDADAIAAG